MSKNAIMPNNAIMHKQTVTNHISYIFSFRVDCQNFILLHDDWRWPGKFYSSSPYSDDKLAEGWYVFLWNGDFINMLRTPPNQYACSTDTPIWFKGEC